MFKYFDPKEVIKQYFYQNIVSLKNETSFTSCELKCKIENLRNTICKYFELDEYIVVFLPNIHVVNEILKQHLKTNNLDDLLIHLNNSDIEFSNFHKKTKNFKFTYLNLDNLIYSFDHSKNKNVDFLTFNPSFTLDVHGVVIFMFKKTYNIQPIYFGSSYDKNIPHSLECGTQNYPNLLLLERYFYFLLKNKKSISDEMKMNKNLINFNHKNTEINP